MRAWITQDGLAGEWQGYAWVILQPDPEGGISFAPGDTVSLGCFTSEGQQYLSRTGNPKWVGAPQPLVAQEQPTEDGHGRQFLLQPGYIDGLVDGTYNVLLLDANGHMRDTTTAPFYNIVYSPLADKNIIQVPEAAATTVLAQDADEPESEGPEEPVPSESGDQGAFQETAYAYAEAPQTGDPYPQQTDAYAEPGNEAPDYAATMPAQAPMQPDKKKSRAWLWILLLIALLAGGAGTGYYFYNQHQEEQANLQAEKEAAEAQAKAEAERKAAEEAARAEAERQAAEQAARAEAERQAAEEAARAEAERQAAEEAARRDTPARVAEFFAGQRDPARAMELASELPADTDEQKDSIFRLYYYAAESGNPEAAMKYAECVDPATPAWGSITKNGAEAYHYYGQAPNGQEAQARVRSWIEEYARRGNASAREWLREIQ